MTIAVTIRTPKDKEASVETHGDGRVTAVKVPKESERLFYVWGDGILVISESE